MAKPEWGTKRTCPSCETRFYDLRRSPIHCPRCDSLVETETSPRLQRPVAARKAVKPVVTISEVEELDIDIPEIEETEDILSDVDEDGETEEDEDDLRGEENDEDEDTLVEDASDLGVDDDDMAEVMEHLEDDRDI